MPPAVSSAVVVERFQDAISKQTFQTVLNSIEERLRNLDNIYSMQFSETIKTKIDHYHMKLDTLDKKLIQLESIIMLNLDKISENISTKNYRNDIAKNQLYRKLDNIYDGLSHRISYIDRKHDMVFEKLQNKVDATHLRIEKVEETLSQRHSDIENEFTDTQIILEELKNSITSNEDTIINVTNNILNSSLENMEVTRNIKEIIQSVPLDFNTSFSESLREIKNISSNNLNISLDSISQISKIKSELKNDYNNYANKVADMSTDIWKKNDLLHNKLQVIENVANSTITEVQNGIRSLMLQIGKISGKEPLNSADNAFDSLKRSINLSFEKILANQGLFLESCHRVQMDESRIETEISSMLGKLLDMLEKKMTTVMKDIKNLEKNLKTHDTKLYRNVYQVSTNIVSLFEKSMKHHDFTERELKAIKFYIDALFTFIQDVLPKQKDSNTTHINDALISISTQINNLTNTIKSDRSAYEKDFLAAKINQTKQHKIHELLIEYLKNITNLISNNKKNMNLSNVESKQKNMPCLQNYRHLIDVRSGDLVECDDIDETAQQNYSTENPKALNLTYSNRTSSTSDNSTSNLSKTKAQNFVDADMQKAILEVFGKPPDLTENNTKTNSKNETNLQLTETNNATSNLNNKSTNVLDKELQEAILEVFGKPPESKNNLNIKHNSSDAILNLNNTRTINAREELPKTILKPLEKPIKMKQNIWKRQKNKTKKQCNDPKKCAKKYRKPKLGIDIRFDDEYYDYNLEDEYESTTETSTENYTSTTEPTTELPQ
ncbi:hypothetical protein GWI33_023132 [Rhynchophorus ferrugineus]|uniref:Uncharacterized protein n=1 Tax=Rhynchophorus ferrugineus TaxID=354439 RepID=A0A834HPB8_RHYFE|nr:hypothetical protein GWI33_023132 [Rhynchophorus ferrugineus]